jgi:putative FmdB family regulatory protein
VPTYEYRCEACGHELEVFQNISAPAKRKCPACKRARLKRKIGGGAGFLFKGSGFYLTDYRSETYKRAAEAERKPEAPSSDKQDAGTGAPPSGPAAAPKAPESKPSPSPAKPKRKAR